MLAFNCASSLVRLKSSIILSNTVLICACSSALNLLTKAAESGDSEIVTRSLRWEAAAFCIVLLLVRRSVTSTILPFVSREVNQYEYLSAISEVLRTPGKGAWIEGGFLLER